MRQVFGVFCAFAFVVAVAGAGVAAEKAGVNILDELSSANAAFEKGQNEIGLTLLQRASDRGDPEALLRVGRIYDEGALVEKDRLRACRSYSLAMERFAKVDRFNPKAALAAEAFRRSADCYAKGLNVSGWERNMNVAANLFFHAGVILQDPASLFELAKLYLAGEGIAQNPAMAVYFLDNAARKRYPPAQALLGSLMWEGKVMKRRAAPGLALLILGKEGTSEADRAWIVSLYDDAAITAPKEVEAEAMLLVEKWKSVYGDPAVNALQMAATVSGADIVPTPSRSPTRQLKGTDLDFVSGSDRFGNQTTRATVPPSAAAPVDRR